MKRILLLLPAVCLVLPAQRGSIAELVGTIRSAIGAKAADGQVARALRREKLTERLDDRTIETLESEGAGPQTVAELLRLKEASVRQPLPVAIVLPAPAPPTADEQNGIWRSAAENAHQYARSLPDFLCTAVTRRYQDPNGAGERRLIDTLRTTLSYLDRKEEYKLLSINGRATVLSYEQAGGATTTGEFGDTVRSIFEDSSQTEYHWDHWTTLRKRNAHVYFFRVPLANSRYQIELNTNLKQRFQTVAGQRGYIYVDDTTKQVLRIAWEAENIPLGFPLRRAASRLDYDFAEIGGREYLVPVAAQTLLDANPVQYRNDLEFREYRKFGAESSISFGEPGTPIKK